MHSIMINEEVSSSKLTNKGPTRDIRRSLRDNSLESGVSSGISLVAFFCPRICRHGCNKQAASLRVGGFAACSLVNVHPASCFVVDKGRAEKVCQTQIVN